MRSLIIIFSILLALSGRGNTYYVKNAGGVGTGLDDANAWSIAKHNSTAIFPGDSVLLKRGDTFYGTLIPQSSQIFYGAYGTGANPVISGLTQLTSWTLYSGNIYYATLNVPVLRLLTVNGSVKPVGRFPNLGYLVYSSHNVAEGWISDASVTTIPFNPAGGELVTRKYRYILDRNTITSKSGNKIYFSDDNNYGSNYTNDPTDLNGYFIQNSLGALDQENEWCYDSSAKRVYIYSPGGVTGKTIQVSTLSENIVINTKSYLSLSGIDYTGANELGINIVGSNHISIIGCNTKSQGGTAIYGLYNDNVSISNCSMKDVNNNGIFAEYMCNKFTIDSIKMYAVGGIQGAGRSGDGAQEGIYVSGDSSIIRNCSVRKVGYNGIGFDGKNCLVEHNLVDSFCMIKDDGGGIYTYNSDSAIIRNNIVLNAIGAFAGAGWAYYEPFGKAAAIYLDNGVVNHHAMVRNNTLAHGEWGGIFVNDNDGNTITKNLCFDYTYGMYLIEFETGRIRNTVIKNNTFIAKTATQKTLFNQMAVNESPSLFGTIDSNYYTRPIDDSLTIQTSIDFYTYTNKTLAGWQTYSGQDAHSHRSLVTINSANNITLFYNPTSADSTFKFNSLYKDIDDNRYANSLVIPAFSGKVLISTSGPVIRGRKAVIIH